MGSSRLCRFNPGCIGKLGEQEPVIQQAVLLHDVFLEVFAYISTLTSHSAVLQLGSVKQPTLSLLRCFWSACFITATGLKLEHLVIYNPSGIPSKPVASLPGAFPLRLKHVLMMAVAKSNA